MRYLLPILVALLLGACGADEQGDETPRENAKPAVVTTEPVQKPVEPPVQAPAEEPPLVEEEVAPPTPKKAAERVKADKKVQKMVQKAPKTKLDLSLPPELTAQLNAEDQAAEDGLAPILPAFFEEKKPITNPFQLSGKLLTGEAGSEFSNSVEGAQLEFEFRR
ncbi:hypothetical protein D16iCDA_02520 [Pseudomonas seleniipraecipitans]|uniref:Translation initiation factor 2 n=1 Tax=Phytopseudomonas seleniipraecipitans TaxID=640205 RepID=A0ABY5JAE5_9GAMM|nr:hypothetical protein [Pseudomonas seleniipraecipitans]UUD64595.1 hypothetical protein D16iCDA_02520 [Pseudomonas seleniipraecipitans]